MFMFKRPHPPAPPPAPKLTINLADALEEHHITLGDPSKPRLDIAISHAIKTIFVVDQTGAGDAATNAIIELEHHLKGLGYHLYFVNVIPEPESPENVERLKDMIEKSAGRESTPQ